MVEIDEKTCIQDPQLVMLPAVYLKGKVKPGQIPLSFRKLSHNTVLVAKHTIVGSL